MARKLVHEANSRSMSESAKHSEANWAIRAGVTSAIAKFSVIPSPWMPATSSPSSSRLWRILSLRLSTYGVITPTRRPPASRMTRRTDAATLNVSAPVSSAMRLISSASYALPRSAPALVQPNTITSGRTLRRSAMATGRCSSSIADSPSGVVSSRYMRAVCSVASAGSRR